eukprot:scaffold4079_cov250-Pinguiococcus_pyrenoidosus.AAC.6
MLPALDDTRHEVGENLAVLRAVGQRLGGIRLCFLAAHQHRVVDIHAEVLHPHGTVALQLFQWEGCEDNSAAAVSEVPAATWIRDRPARAHNLLERVDECLEQEAG